jgi:hypothetical protein
MSVVIALHLMENRRARATGDSSKTILPHVPALSKRRVARAAAARTAMAGWLAPMSPCLTL